MEFAWGFIVGVVVVAGIGYAMHRYRIGELRADLKKAQDMIVDLATKLKNAEQRIIDKGRGR